MRVIVIGAALAAAMPASAQYGDKAADRITPAAAKGTELSLSLQIAPAFGKKKPLNENEDLVDEGSYDLSALLSFDMGPGTRLNLAPGISYSPQLFDDGDPKSTIYGQAKLQTKLRVGPGPSEALRDEITGFAGYKYARGYTSFLGDYASSDHSFSVGVTYQNALWLYCELERCAADAQGTVAGQKGLAVELTPSYAYVTSPDPLRRRHQPGALLKFSIPTRFSVTPFASAAYEHRGYTDQLVPGVGKRNDDKLTLEAGIGLTRKVAPMTDIKLSVAGRFQQNWSNLAGQSYDRFYIVPGITFERSLKP